MAPQVVQLNVGGTIFATTRQTLGSCPGSYLAGLISEDHPQVIQYLDGAIFVDRSPECFGLVLNWLRGCKVCLRPGSREANLLLEEAEYYGLPALSKLLKPEPEEQKAPGAPVQLPPLLAVAGEPPSARPEQMQR